MNRRGFTFIELVTVWAIICILAAILFPVFAKAREKARQSNCITNLLNIGAGLRMYSADHWGYLPPTNNDLTPLLSPRYLAESGSLVCPTLRGDQLFDYPPQSPQQMRARRTGFDYVYRGGLADDDPPDQAIAADRFRDTHNDGANTLFLDGHAKWLNAKQFEMEMEAVPLTPGSPPGGYAPGSAPMAGLLQLGKLQVKLSGSGYRDQANQRGSKGGGRG